MSHSPLISVAPMMELTDRHFRYMMRLISRHTLLYSEMLTSKAVLHGERSRLLAFDPQEHPVALQLGGNDPAELAAAAAIGAEAGYDEINLNVGCPSDRVQSGRFGACLMAEPRLVGQCLRAMQEAVQVPVTVKCRTGIDRSDSWEALRDFVTVVAGYGCNSFAVHARKAWLDGLSPKQNRSIPPLRYDFVYRLKQHFPELTVVINGGIRSWDEIGRHLQHTDGVMIGREAYYNPSLLLEADQRLFAAQRPAAERHAVAIGYAQYMQRQFEAGVPLSAMTRHLIALYQRVPGARAWRRHLSTGLRHCQSPLTLVREALAHLAPPQDATQADCKQSAR